MPPELKLGAQATPQSDIYALGVTLSEEVETLKLPYTNRELANFMRHDFLAIIAKATMSNPQDRYQSAEDFRADFEHLFAMKPVAARRPKTRDAVAAAASRLVSHNVFTSVLGKWFSETSQNATDVYGSLIRNESRPSSDREVSVVKVFYATE